MILIRDVHTGRGTTKQEGGGQVKFYPYKKGGSFSHAEGGRGTKGFEVVLTRHVSSKFKP